MREMLLDAFTPHTCNFSLEVGFKTLSAIGIKCLNCYPLNDVHIFYPFTWNHVITGPTFTFPTLQLWLYSSYIYRFQTIHIYSPWTKVSKHLQIIIIIIIIIIDLRVWKRLQLEPT